MKQWQLQEAKAKLSEVIQKSNIAPQKISVRGKVEAIVLSVKQYNSLTLPKFSLVKFLQNSPLYGTDLEFNRDKSSCREIEL